MVPEKLFDVRGGYTELSEEHAGKMTAAVAGALWLIDDVQTARGIVELVDLLTRLTRRDHVDAAEMYEQSGNGWFAVITETDVTLTGRYYRDRPPFVLSHEDALAILGQYWDCRRLSGGRARFRQEVERFTNVRGRAPEIPFVLELPRIRKRRR
ncbi:hypothetical protein ACFVUS_31315 [Nocardia sp. NPDC058058]|uniref:hypothetical protein n=1 Tax=Nocardia sp. NPDC058058 TaxID=3346317 RepID=UPI0036DD532A